MNDFTKEELEDIYAAVTETSVSMIGHLPVKIQSMIDNYCEHEFQIKSLNPHFIMMCEKCSKTFVDGNFPG